MLRKQRQGAKVMNKNPYKLYLTVFAISLLIFISCKKEVQNPAIQLFEENPTTISWDSSKSNNIDTFSATVSVYEDSNRRTGGAKLKNQYKMAVKSINDKQYVRLDFPATANISAKSILTNGADAILVDTATNEIEQKIYAAETDLKLISDFDFFLSQHTLSKIDLSKVRTEAAKLSLDMTENKVERSLTVELPSRYFSSQSEKRLSTKISYDTAHELMETIETVTELENGTLVTVTTCPVYEEIEGGEIIKIGQYSIIDRKSEIRYEGLEEIEYFDSLESNPEISQEEYEKFVDEGNAVVIDEFPLGNPADPSSVETVIELYEDIQINMTDDSMFKLIMEL